MKRSLNLTGTAGKSYDLDSLKNENTRTSANEGLVVEVWYWNPSYTSDNVEKNYHNQPNPNNPEIGRIWLSKKVSIEVLRIKLGD